MQPNQELNRPNCPAEDVLKIMSGKWRPQIFKLALDGPVRFSGLLKTLEKSNKQSIALALKELEYEDLLDKKVIKVKPLHIEYTLSAKGKELITVFRQLEDI
ncbi:winged helix-turn-helix transcriptional regulator [Pedobacter sp. N23S346]|uniref:winged helix-turn-helix transcriptional regulator n=1 Tax=Pedobacter sp. N23S346 TaxID=3402750 RepID=UPI003ACB99F9